MQEKLFNTRLSAFVDKYKVINPSQYGFRENMSTSYAPTELVNEITTSLDSKMHTMGVFIDLKKAFDTVDHKLLCEKVEFYGIRGVAHNWIRSYLSNRSQFVCFDGFHSNLLNISCGVPQSNNTLSANIDITINGVNIDRVRVAKFLGLLIDEKLNWKDHIASVKSKLSKSIAKLYKCNQLVDIQSMHILYCSMFLPYINYCSEIWGNTYPTNISGIVILQKRAMRLLYGANRIDHTTPLFYRSHALKFVDLVKFKTAVFRFKAYQCKLPVNIQQHFVKKDISTITRQTNQLVRCCVTTNEYLNSTTAQLHHFGGIELDTPQ